MSARSRAAYFAQIERPIAWCMADGCRNRGARHSKKDGLSLCKGCRVARRSKPRKP